MSYLLIGNISALIGHDCVEPLVNARVRIYLPELSAQVIRPASKGIFNDMVPLSAKEVLMKADRLLAEATLDSKGNFSVSWKEIHLFTEELELDLCLDQLPGKNGATKPRNFHLSRLVLHWKRNTMGYVGAYAYVIPADIWQQIYANAGAWVITGLVKNHESGPGLPDLSVEAYNAINGQVIGHGFTNEVGRYYLYFSRQHLSSGNLQPISSERVNMGPDVYFKIYQKGQLIWEEDEKMANMPERKDVGHCAQLNIICKPSRVRKASGQIGNWLTEIITLTGTRKKKSDTFRLLTHPSLL
ncbi:hypothetical protein DVR12_25995 [Chitinophaga silvatica]|uniref:Uncharacterized protein n=1 Tax=Chitinophaga silvatica TaxID=2282649 RepID=A0A3E1Y2I6_9BACT|nr:hypothetical protein [Chitinophaga silvatica]RFS18836.1 hypothetical protein DVR12_25995 [Chitinophaga silvatica]